MMTQESVLARYRILHELGRGAIGAVYAARDRETGAAVALKRLDPALSSKSDANFADRFLKHARSAQLLKHPNIVKIHDAGKVAGTVYVAMEMLEGESLRKILDAGPLPMARAIQIAHDIACGLAHAHLQGVVHEGLKPSNVIVSRSGVVKITDFGIGQAALSYMSPEQMRGGPVDHRCDVFALGALFYEMLTHRPPFEGGSPKEFMEKMLHSRPPRPSELNQHVPRALDAIVLGMLAAAPVARMSGVPVLLRDLQRLDEALGLGPGANARSAEPTVSAPPAKPEPGPRTPEPGPPSPEASRIRDAAPMQDLPRIADREAFDYQKAMAMMDRESGPKRSSGSRPVIFAAALGLAVLGIGLAGFVYYSSSGPSERAVAASRVQEAPSTAPAASRPAAPPPVAEATEEPATAPDAPPAAEPSPLAQAESVVVRAPEPPAPAAPAPAQELPPPTQPAAKVPKQQPAGMAQVIVAVSPRGEIYIDGKHHGTTPPVTTLNLEPGMHRIEVRSGSRRPYLTYMTVQAGDVRRIRHDFDASRAVPPKSANAMNAFD